MSADGDLAGGDGRAGEAPALRPERRPGTVRGRQFRLLWAAFASSNLGDGVLLAAGPLLVTSLTRDPFLVSLAVTVQLAPTLLLSLPVGAVVDRVDRTRLQVLAHATRAVVVALLAVAIAGGVVTLPLLYAALFALGAAEVFADTAGQTLVVATVDREDAGRATSRLVGTRIVANDLAGPPIGALLFGIGAALPYALDVVLLAAAAVLVGRMAIDARPDGAEPGPAAGLLADVREGWRFVVATPPVRRLAVLIAVFNITFGAPFGVWVLWALERLGLDELGFGVLLTASAVGGLLGSAVFPRLERRFRYATLLRVGLVVETCTHLLLAASTSPLLAGAVLVAFGVHEAVWGSLSGAIRLRVVPEQMLGRVNGVYRLAVFGPLVAGTAIGGLLADRFGILAPFLYAGAGAGLATVWAWRSMDDLGAAGGLPAVAGDDLAGQR